MKDQPANADPAALTALGKIALATMQNYDEAAAKFAGSDFLSVGAASTTFTAKDDGGTWKLTMERTEEN